MIDRILQLDVFKQRPPVLVDVGASGGIHSRWKSLAKYSYCIAFDADDREMKVTEDSSSGFRKLITINRIVTDRDEREIDFYLTASPYCSSTLEPDMKALASWPFQALFRVEKKARLKAVRLMDALQEAGINRIDWLKIDTQGTDLRIFKSLSPEMQQQVLVAEFEPGILDAYRGEDKLHEVMRYLQDGFLMTGLEVKGVMRIEAALFGSLSALLQRALRTSQRSTPGWAEVTYMNLLKSGHHDARSFQLMYVFALVERQHGFALEIARSGFDRFRDPFFQEMEAFALKKMKGESFKWPFFAVRNRLNRLFDALFD